MDLLVPELGENIEKALVVKILVQVGDSLKINVPVVELETDKAVMEVPSTLEGVVTKIYVKEGEKIKIGSPILSMTVSENLALPKKSIPEKMNPEAPVTPLPTQIQKPVETKPMPRVYDSVRLQNKSGVVASPSVRRLAREIGVDIYMVPGSGKSQRISLEDVKIYSKVLHESRTVSLPEQFKSIALPDFSKWGPIEIKPMSGVRTKTAVHLAQASLIPHVTQFEKIDITELEIWRKQYLIGLEAEGAKLTMTVLLLKALATALSQYKMFNASVNMANEEIIYKNYIHIGVAVDTDRGLLVPVIRDVNKKTLAQLVAELGKISKLAREKKLTREEMQGGCMTISNLGGLGGTYFTPIINAPEVAILGVSRSDWQPKFNVLTKEFAPHYMMPLSLSYDHRLIDGADAVRFLLFVKKYLEELPQSKGAL